MSRSVFLLAASSLALVACQPAENAADTLEAETPPVVEETVEVEVATVVEAAAETEADHDDHDDHEDHDADEHDEDEHAHDDDHDHDEADGEAHVHGHSDLAASLDGSTLSISVEGALANFDLDESLRTLEDTTPYTDNLVAISGGDCTRDSASASIRAIGDHGNLMVDLTYTCATPDTISAIDVTGFQTFAGFEEVSAVYLTDSGQTAETLTTSDTRLDIN